MNPLVDIRSRLVNRRDTELFSVTSTAPAYWRVSGLPQFDGNTWDLPDRSLEDVDGSLSEAAPGSTPNEQQIEVAALRGKLVPGAAEPVRASGDGLRWNAEMSTLVRVDRDLEEGDRFDIVSAMPSFSPDVLRAASSTAPPDPIYLELPDGFPVSIAATASEVTAGAPTTYDKMLTLQDWFRTNFRYSLDVPQGHSTSAIEAFLRQRIGYCEQFAGTFAAMARGLGIPARVAVGYTPGLLQADGTRAVLGKNAHAWPEIWFDGLGWVPFEPTPGARCTGCRDPHRRRARPGRSGARPGDGRGRCRWRRSAGDAVAGADPDRSVARPGPDPGARTDRPRLLDAGAGPRRELEGLRHRSPRPRPRRGDARHRPSLAARPSERRRAPPDRRAVAPCPRCGGRNRVSHRSDDDTDRAGPRHLPAPAGGGPSTEVAGRGRDGRHVRHRRRDRPPGGSADRRRARAAALVPTGRADRRGLDDDGWAPAPVLHGLGLMYRSAVNRVDDLTASLDLLRGHGFGHLVVTGPDGLDAVAGAGARRRARRSRRRRRRRGRSRASVPTFAKANPIWRRAPCAGLLIVQPTDAYVSPGYYPSKHDDPRVVPTWNYEVVHVHGTVQAHDDAAWLARIVRDLTVHHESTRAQPWSVNDAPGDYVARMLRAIVGIELEVTRIEATRKLSQNRSATDVAGVVAGLAAGRLRERRTAAAMNDIIGSGG